MISFGNVPIGSVLPIPFASYAGSTGASVTLTGLAVTDIEVYKGTSVTQRSSDAGYALIDTDGIDIDGLTGIHGFSIDTGDNTDSGFYAAGSFYSVVVSAVTIDSQTVNFIAATFRLLAAENTAGVPVADTVRVSGTTQTARDIGASVLLSSGTGTGQLKLASGYVAMTWADVAAPTTTVNLSGTTIATTQKVDVETIKTNPVVNGGTITFPTGATLASTTNITAGTVTVGAMAADVLTAAATASDFGTEVGTAVWATTTRALTILDEDSTTLDLDATIRAAVGLASANLDTQLADLPTNAELATALGTADDAILAVLGTPAGASISADIAAIEAQTDDIGTAGAGLSAIPWNAAWDAEVQSEVADALTASGLTAAGIADAVWDETLSGHVGAGSTGEALAAAGAAGDPWITALPGSYTAGQAGYIVGTNVNATISSRATQTSVDDLPTNAELATALDPLPTAAENATAVWAAGTRSLTVLDEDSTTLDLDATIRAAVGLASANLDTQLADLPTNAELATALGTADDAVLAAVAAVQADVDVIREYADNTVIRGTSAGSATTTTMTPSALSPAGVDADQFKGRILVFDNDTTTTALRGQATDITASSAAGLPLLTFTALTTAPASGDTFSIV